MTGPAAQDAPSAQRPNNQTRAIATLEKSVRALAYFEELLGSRTRLIEILSATEIGAAPGHRRFIEALRDPANIDTPLADLCFEHNVPATALLSAYRDLQLLAAQVLVVDKVRAATPDVMDALVRASQDDLLPCAKAQEEGHGASCPDCFGRGTILVRRGDHQARKLLLAIAGLSGAQPGKGVSVSVPISLPSPGGAEAPPSWAALNTFIGAADRLLRLSPQGGRVVDVTAPSAHVLPAAAEPQEEP